MCFVRECICTPFFVCSSIVILISSVISLTALGKYFLTTYTALLKFPEELFALKACLNPPSTSFSITNSTFWGRSDQAIFSKSNEWTSSTETGSFGLTSFPSFIICEIDKLFGNKCLAFGEAVLCTLFVGYWRFGCGGVTGSLKHCCLDELDASSSIGLSGVLDDLINLTWTYL